METGAFQSQNGSFQQHPPAITQMGGEMNHLEEGGSLDFWGVLRRRFFLIAFFLVTTIGLGVLYLFNATPKFESTTRVQIIPEKPVSVNFGQNQFGDSNYRDPLSASHPNSMLSSRVLAQVLVDQGLIKSQTFSEIANPAQPNEISQSVVDYISGNLHIDQDKDDEYMYELSFRSKFKEDSGRFLNSLVDVYRQSLTSGYQAEITAAVEKLSEVNATFQQKSKTLDEQIKEFRRVNPIPKLDQAGNTVARKMVDTLFPQYQEAVELLNEKNQLLKQVEVFKEMGNGASVILDVLLNEEDKGSNYEEMITIRDLIEKPRAELMNVIIQRDALKRKFGDKHPQVEIVEQQIKSLQSLIAERLAQSNSAVDIPASDRLNLVLTKLVAEQQSQQARVDNLSRRLSEYQMDAEKYAQIMIEEQELLAQKERDYELLRRATQSLEEMKVAEKDDGYKFEILNRAVEGVQVEPSPLIVFGLSAILGSLLGFGIAYLVDLADKTFRSPHEIIKTLNLALIGHIPVIRGGKPRDTESQMHPVLCTFHKPKAQASEAFRAVRTAIYFSTQGQRHQVIQVTSPTPGDGKSTLATNLAITIAQSGKRVLLVDGDMRRPSIHKLFKMEETPGFSDVLVEQISLLEAIQVSEVDGLDVLPCGNKPIQPSELLTSHRLPEVIDELRQMYDFVIIDTPPVLVVTDPCPVAANVDGVICAMRIKKNVRVSAERMVEILRSVNANIIGIVVNGVGAQGTYSSQYSYGAYQSGYSSYGGYGYGGYGRYGQSEKSYDDGRRPELALPKRRIAETVHVDQE